MYNAYRREAIKNSAKQLWKFTLDKERVPELRRDIQFEVLGETSQCGNFL